MAPGLVGTSSSALNRPALSKGQEGKPFHDPFSPKSSKGIATSTCDTNGKEKGGGRRFSLACLRGNSTY
jgi:hypothetical protein